ncbi:putative aldouronate transport system substrate-binding protein [Paenibacillus cellulosilyticus]|uniref:Putative aldouronate transport system substrate-binding protein n=1 Tax=Paenibacillus cellulosilyticus TaxID=375489 RepID=A0A2V2YE99_9BACL|nr:extracellular solute-binding protein [Paenibacillus cellulosilyticus]PWV90626.1 putative aldouronate transport system substrate-binding protein [Paenibacillus cellulosilyticus]QKS43951.1 extracellular solute-binding protein [Paenibacillus cellulosilyticus]
MKRQIKTFSTLLIALMMMVTVLAACGSSDSDNGKSTGTDTSTDTKSTDTATDTGGDDKTADASKPDTSKKVQLVWYLLGDAHKDTPKVVEEWNKMLEKDLNVTVKLNFTTWTDWTTKYNLLLASGEKIDMIFASSWADYYKFANQGAFMPLDDLLPTYAPETWKSVPQQDWKEATVNGKIYAVPATYPEYTPDGIVYREDWRKELNLPEIKDLDSIEAYLDGVKKAKNVTPINGKAYNEIFTMFKSYYNYQQIGGDSGVVVAKSYDAPRDIVAYPFTTEFEQWAHKMKEWKDKGFWKSDTLSDQKEAGDAIKTGQGAVYWRNAPGAGGYIMGLQTSNPDIEMGYFPFSRFNNLTMPTLSVNNAMAIPKSAANPERSLMVLDKLRNDPKYYDLMNYGLEGTNYSVDTTDSKYIVSPPAGTPKDDKDHTAYGVASWGYRVESMERVKQAGGWPGFDALLTEFKSQSKPNIFAGVLMDYAPVKSQQAAVNSVIQQYGMPIMMGLVPDVDKAIANYRKQLEAAGVNDVMDYIKEQANKYYDSQGIK